MLGLARRGRPLKGRADEPLIGMTLALSITELRGAL